MGLTIDDLIAREETRDTLNAYSHGLDQRNWELFDRVFSLEATFAAPAKESTRISAQDLKSRLQENNDGDTARPLSEVTWMTQQTMDKPNMVFQVIANGL